MLFFLGGGPIVGIMIYWRLYWGYGNYRIGQGLRRFMVQAFGCLWVSDSGMKS